MPKLHWSHAQCTPTGKDVTGKRNHAKSRLSSMPKRKMMAQPEISHAAAEQLMRDREDPTCKNFADATHASHQLAPLQHRSNVFFCSQRGAVNGGGTVRPLKSQCDGSGESRRKARLRLERDKIPDAHVLADEQRRHQQIQIFKCFGPTTNSNIRIQKNPFCQKVPASSSPPPSPFSHTHTHCSSPRGSFRSQTTLTLKFQSPKVCLKSSVQNLSPPIFSANETCLNILSVQF